MLHGKLQPFCCTHVNAETLRTMESIINREVVNSGNLLVQLLLCYVKLSDVD